MACSATTLSPRPLELAPAQSLSDLATLCSGPLDLFLEEAAARSKQARGAPRGGHGHGSKKAASSCKVHAAGGLQDAQRLAKLRAANEIVRNSWQFKVGGCARVRACAACCCIYWTAAHTAAGVHAALRLARGMRLALATPMQATGSVKAAAVLAGVHARRLASGGPEGLAAQVRVDTTVSCGAAVTTLLLHRQPGTPAHAHTAPHHTTTHRTTLHHKTRPRRSSRRTRWTTPPTCTTWATPRACSRRGAARCRA